MRGEARAPESITAALNGAGTFLSPKFGYSVQRGLGDRNVPAPVRNQKSGCGRAYSGVASPKPRGGNSSRGGRFLQRDAAAIGAMGRGGFVAAVADGAILGTVAVGRRVEPLGRVEARLR